MKLLVVIHESYLDYECYKYYLSSNQIVLSYNAFITYNSSKIVYLTKPNKRVRGADFSNFNNEAINNSVNDFSYHICLESPSVSNKEDKIHVGYTNTQYYNLAWLCKALRVEEKRIVLHKDIDLSLTSKDPRSFSRDKLNNYLNRILVNKYLDTGLA